MDVTLGTREKTIAAALGETVLLWTMTARAILVVSLVQYDVFKVPACYSFDRRGERPGSHIHFSSQNDADLTDGPPWR